MAVVILVRRSYTVVHRVPVRGVYPERTDRVRIGVRVRVSVAVARRWGTPGEGVEELALLQNPAGKD